MAHSTLSTLSAQVSSEHASMQAARDLRLTRTAELLQAVVDVVRPALPALVTRDPVTGERLVEVVKGLALDESGAWRQLGLIADGKCAVASLVDVASSISDVGTVTVRLEALLRSHVGKRAGVTASIERDADRLHAVAVLLRAGEGR